MADLEGKCSSLYLPSLCPLKSFVVHDVKYLKALEGSIEIECVLGFVVVLVWYISFGYPELYSFSIITYSLGQYSLNFSVSSFDM